MATVGLRVVTGNSNPKLAQEICDHLGISMGRARIDRFSDGETLVELGESVRGTDLSALILVFPCRLGKLDGMTFSSMRRI